MTETFVALANPIGLEINVVVNYMLKMKRIKEALEAMQIMASVVFYAVAAYAVYYIVFIKQMWMVAE